MTKTKRISEARSDSALRTLNLSKDAVRLNVATAQTPQHEGQPAKFHSPRGISRGAKGPEQLL